METLLISYTCTTVSPTHLICVVLRQQKDYYSNKFVFAFGFIQQKYALSLPFRRIVVASVVPLFQVIFLVKDWSFKLHFSRMALKHKW